MFEDILKNYKVLIVGGDTRSRAFLRAVLMASTDATTELAEATTFDEAIKILPSFKSDLIIAERTADTPDGLELLRRIRGGFKDVSRFTPYILLTDEADARHCGQARDAGANQCLEKPVSVTELYQEIAAIFRNTQPFVNCHDYFGPNRRQHETHYSGDNRRYNNAIFVSPPIPVDPFVGTPGGGHKESLQT